MTNEQVLTGAPAPARTLVVEAGGPGGIAMGGAGAAGASPTRFVDHLGPVIAHVRLQLVFWGGAWSAPGNHGPSVRELEAAAATIVSGSYLAGLAEYRGIGTGRLLPSVVVSESEPPSPFADSDVIKLLKSLLESRRVADPDGSTLLCVMMPPGVSCARGNVIGEHSYFHYWDAGMQPPRVELGTVCAFAWVTNDGTRDGMTTILSHEIAEAVTDPQGSAILGADGVCDADGWCEIGDVCELETGTCDGVAVQAYWSQRASRCIVPDRSTAPAEPATVVVQNPPAPADHRLDPAAMVADIAAVASAVRSALPSLRPGDHAVELSFVLGWHVAEVFLLQPPQPAPADHPDASPLAGPRPLAMTSVDRLAPAEQHQLLLAQIDSDLAAMRRVGVVNLYPPPLGVTAAALAEDQAGYREKVAAWDLPVLAHLTAANYRYGKAYSLGRQLCALTGQPTIDQTLAMFGDADICARTSAWLSDLKSSFGTCATDATQLTLDQWHQWAEAGRERPADIEAAIARQGQVWRSLLSGEKQAPDVLHPSQYLKAGEELVEQYVRLGWRFVRTSRWPLIASVALLALVVAGIAVTVSLTPALAAAGASLLGIVGLAGAGARTAARQALAFAEGPIWEAQLTKAVTMAVSHAPSIGPQQEQRLWQRWWAPEAVARAVPAHRRQRPAVRA